MKIFICQDFPSKRCFLPHVNTKILEECPEEYKINPDNDYIKIRYKELTKGTYHIGGGSTEGYSSEFTQQQTSSKKSYYDSVQWGQTSSGNSLNTKQEAVQLYPQEINLTLRISKIFINIFPSKTLC